MARRVAAGVAALALGAVLLGAPVIVLQLPFVTSTLVARFYDPVSGGVPRPLALKTAEHVRAYTTETGAPDLPAEVGGRPGFDASASSHLRDVRGVLQAARALTLVLGALLAAMLALAIPARAYRAIALALRAGAIGTLVLVVGAGVWGALDFERFFAVFHGLFFAAGTWTFPSGTLLIELFPEPLWATLGALWAGGVLLGAAVSLVAAHMLVRVKRGHVGQDV